MEDAHNRSREMFVRVKDFGAAHASDFSPTGLACRMA